MGHMRPVGDCCPGRGGMSQDGGTRQRAEHFMEKWTAAEEVEAELRHAVACPNVTGRIKDRIFQSKRAHAGLVTIVD